MAAMVKVIEVLAQSEKSWDDAAKVALEEASKTLRGIQSIYVKEMQAIVKDNRIVQYRLNAKISFRSSGKTDLAQIARGMALHAARDLA
jgi:dodecin